MASSRLTSFPEDLRIALDMRSGVVTCPPEVEAIMATLSYFQQDAKPAKRFGNLTASSDSRPSGWRSGGGGSHSGGGSDGFQVYTNRRRAGYEDDRDGGGRGYHGNRNGGYGGGHSGSRGYGGRTGGYGSHSGGHSSHGDSRHGHSHGGGGTSAYGGAGRGEERNVIVEVKPPVASEPIDTTPKFSSQAVKAVADTGDRILARVKGKINKIGHSTYDATKTFMQQILDSTEIEFLDELMKFVFMKAATESSFCPLYARLLHELADEFTHLRTVMNRIFLDYTAIFTEVEGAPDVGTEDYKAFVEAQERKKFRRGYSQFVAELVKCGEADKDAFGKLIIQIVRVLETSHNNAEKTLLCEEYIDCLSNMCTSASAILSASEGAADIKNRLSAIVKKPRSEIPGLTNKGRFALMDLVEFAERGWK
jgi:hypothetical protein